MMPACDILKGTHVYLAAITEEDVTAITRWYQDAAFLRLLDARPAAPRTSAQVREEFEAAQKSHNDYTFAVRLLATGEPIGFVEIDGILWAHRTAGLGAGLGSAEHRGKGYGTEACRLALDFAFNELNLHRITGTVFSYNAASLRMCERLGFQREGVFREFLERGGQRYDMILLGLLQREWRALNSP